MPIINADDGCPINVEISGRENGPVLMLSNLFGTDLTMWDDQAGEFAKQFRLIRYDRRGHGRSGAPAGPYSFDRFGRDILAILDALKMFPGPIIELHISNIHRREEHYQRSYVSKIATAVIAGLGAPGYRHAVRAIREMAG